MIKVIQDHFQDSLLESRLTIQESSILQHLSITGFVSPQKGLDIYYNAYKLRLIETLANDYPKLKEFSGEKRFNEIAIEFIQNFPSKHPSLRYFGSDFVNFITKHPAYSKKTYFSEMAAFEWKLGDTLDAGDSPLATLETLKDIPPPKWNDLKLLFHPSFQMIKLHWNIPKIWQAIDNKDNVLPKLRKTKKPIIWILVRSNLQTVFRSTEKNESYALELAHHGTTIGEICESLCDKISEKQIPLFVLTCLQKWTQDGIIADFLY
jgi:hypothetical protein